MQTAALGRCHLPVGPHPLLHSRYGPIPPQSHLQTLGLANSGPPGTALVGSQWFRAAVGLGPGCSDVDLVQQATFAHLAAAEIASHHQWVHAWLSHHVEGHMACQGGIADRFDTRSGADPTACVVPSGHRLAGTDSAFLLYPSMGKLGCTFAQQACLLAPSHCSAQTRRASSYHRPSTGWSRQLDRCPVAAQFGCSTWPQGTGRGGMVPTESLTYRQSTFCHLRCKNGQQ
jgi:hypothetical protein